MGAVPLGPGILYDMPTHARPGTPGIVYKSPSFAKGEYPPWLAPARATETGLNMIPPRCENLKGQEYRECLIKEAAVAKIAESARSKVEAYLTAHPEFKAKPPVYMPPPKTFRGRPTGL